MKDWRLPAAVFLLIIVIALPVLTKRRVASAPQRADFLRYTTGYLLVRVVDTDGAEMMYRFSDGATVLDVKKMTGKGSAAYSLNREILSKRLQDGDVVEFTGSAGNVERITLKNMATAERIVLGIPLDPDLMSIDDWMSLPGVGRSLAEAIVADRQKNGIFGAIERVSRVPGIGPGRIKSLRKYFIVS